MASRRIPDLTFPGVDFGAIETPWDLRPLLYSGGAKTYVRQVADRIANGELGAPIDDRLPLVRLLHDHLASRLAEGALRPTVAASIAILRSFFAWIDTTGRRATLTSAERVYIEYSEHLLHRVRVLRNLSEASAYTYALNLAAMLDNILELKSGLLAKTRLSKPKVRKHVLGADADKQNLEGTAAFVHALLDIADALTVETIRGPVPVTIRLRSGHAFAVCCRLKPLDNLKMMLDPKERRVIQRRRAAWATDTSTRTRYPLINMRIEAELLIFIANTGMNLAQASALRIGNFRYQSNIDGYRVFRVHKGRRGGEVEFNIYSEYRALFERYLQWRNAIIPGSKDDRLFPFVLVRGAIRRACTFSAISERFKALGLPLVLPRDLRSTRVNWLLRRTQDPQLTAEMNQHSKETLLRVYDQPHHQTALVEISRFLASADPAIAMPGPGACAGSSPTPVPNSPPSAPLPDCVSPAGCLFCTHHRDMDTDDHVWSLATYRRLKSVELAQYRPSPKSAVVHPASSVVDRVTAKLKHFEASSKVRAMWVSEALARVDEGDYHPKWDAYIQLMELRSWA